MNIIRGSESKRGRVPPIVFSLALCALAIFSFVMLRDSAYRSESALLKAASEKIALRVSAKLQAMLDTGEQFRQLLRTEGGRTYAALRPLAEDSLARSSYIDSITIAPGAIVRYSFPEDRASASIGHDLLNNPERMQALVEAVREKKAVLQGPSVSAEGEDLAFLRIPVMDKADLWGFVSIGFDIDRMLADLDISSEFPGLFVAIASSGTDGRGRQVFWGDQRALQGYEVAVTAGSEDFPWTVYTASSYPVVRVVWWGAGLLALSIVSLVLFMQGMVAGRQRQKRTLSAPSLKEASFVVTPFVQKAEENEGPLPEVAAQDQAAPASTALASSEEGVRAAVRTPVSVLVVDDSEVNRELLFRMLTLKGYEAQSVSSSEMALDAIKERSFDVLLIDCIMPKTDGYALASAIRNIIGEAPSLMIAMSPRHDPQETEKCRAAGFDSVLIKPFTMTSLDQKIQETLYHKGDKVPGG